MTETSAPAPSQSFPVYVFRRWLLVLIVGFLGGVAGVAASFLLRKTYRSELVAVPAARSDARGALGESLGGLSSLASLAGINLNGGNSGRDADLEYLKSRELLRRFITRHDAMPVLYAARWDAANKKWRGEPPTLDAAVAMLQNRVVSILLDRRTGAIKVSVTLNDPEIAAKWANLIVADANSDLRTVAQDNARRSIDFLNAELSKTSLLGVEQAIYRLIEGQINSIMLANVSADYAFRVVDPAVPSDPHRYASPNRMLIGMMGSMFAGTLLLILLFARFIRRQTPP